MCIGFIVGTTVKYYHSKTVNEKSLISSSDRTTFSPAFGLTFRVRYYVYKNVECNLDGCLGYKTDFASCGLINKIH